MLILLHSSNVTEVKDTSKKFWALWGNYYFQKRQEMIFMKIYTPEYNAMLPVEHIGNI